MSNTAHQKTFQNLLRLLKRNFIDHMQFKAKN